MRSMWSRVGVAWGRGVGVEGLWSCASTNTCSGKISTLLTQKNIDLCDDTLSSCGDVHVLRVPCGFHNLSKNTYKHVNNFCGKKTQAQTQAYNSHKTLIHNLIKSNLTQRGRKKIMVFPKKKTAKNKTPKSHIGTVLACQKKSRINQQKTNNSMKTPVDHLTWRKRRQRWRWRWCKAERTLWSKKTRDACQQWYWWCKPMPRMWWEGGGRGGRGWSRSFSAVLAEAVLAVERGVDVGDGGGRELGEGEGALPIRVHLSWGYPRLLQSAHTHTHTYIGNERNEAFYIFLWCFFSHWGIFRQNRYIIIYELIIKQIQSKKRIKIVEINLSFKTTVNVLDFLHTHTSQHTQKGIKS